jgi:hypothetical protein
LDFSAFSGFVFNCFKLDKMPGVPGRHVDWPVILQVAVLKLISIVYWMDIFTGAGLYPISMERKREEIDTTRSKRVIVLVGCCRHNTEPSSAFCSLPLPLYLPALQESFAHPHTCQQIAHILKRGVAKQCVEDLEEVFINGKLLTVC